MLEKIQFRTKKDGVTSLTEQINAFVEKSGVQSGLLCAFPSEPAALPVHPGRQPGAACDPSG